MAARRLCPGWAEGAVGKAVSGRRQKLSPEARERLSKLMQELDLQVAKQAMDEIISGARSLEAWEAFARRMPGAAAQQPIGWSQ